MEPYNTQYVIDNKLSIIYINCTLYSLHFPYHSLPKNLSFSDTFRSLSILISSSSYEASLPPNASLSTRSSSRQHLTFLTCVHLPSAYDASGWARSATHCTSCAMAKLWQVFVLLKQLCVWFSNDIVQRTWCIRHFVLVLRSLLVSIWHKVHALPSPPILSSVWIIFVALNLIIIRHFCGKFFFPRKANIGASDQT